MEETPITKLVYDTVIYYALKIIGSYDSFDSKTNLLVSHLIKTKRLCDLTFGGI